MNGIVPKKILILFEQGFLLHQQGNITKAEEMYREVLKLEPSHFDSLHLMGVALYQTNHFFEALNFINQALSVHPYHIAALSNKGLILKSLGQFEEAILTFSKVIEIEPKNAQAFVNKGNTLIGLQEFEDALACYNTAIDLQDDYALAYTNRGSAFHNLQKYQEAFLDYQKALILQPNSPQTLMNQGNTLREMRLFEQALSSYDLAIKNDPLYAEAYMNKGLALKEQGELTKAVDNYNQAILINPHFAEALSNKGIAQLDLNELTLAVDSFRSAISLKPNFGDAHLNLGIAHNHLGQLDESLRYFNLALELNPSYQFIHGTRMHLKMQMCLWENFDHEVDSLSKKIIAKQKVTATLPLLAMIDSPKLQYEAACIWGQHHNPENFTLGDIAPNQRGNKIRIAYFSADFYYHAVSILMAGVFEAHNRDVFEIYAFSLRTHTPDLMTQRLEGAFDHFLEVGNKTDQEIASMAREFKIDIAVDLGGYTKNSRTNIFAYRAAPIQMSYIGYLGTMGLDYMDYLIADPVLIPEDKQEYYSEKILYLPHYQANDSNRASSNRILNRADVGLPQDAFVFCCLNNNYKITPAIFSCWMRILRKVENSILFLYVDNDYAKINLIKEAEKNGVSSTRLAFTKRVALDDYRLLYKLADLFLDTHPYNAGTTASDALWAGLPVLTYLGEAFASRIAASILSAIGLAELIVSDQLEYEKLAIDLAKNPDKLNAIKQKLLANQTRTPLLNTSMFTQHLEMGFEAVMDRYYRGLSPDHIYIKKISET
jgi:predicted O-linked N-acetylglucosamine transferase (SPINDLY family)